tara:strand:+ start:392 stop:952 length:561 start_codon:yes stop_codon:yes gene_type:complete
MRQYYIYKLECNNAKECHDIYVGSTYDWERRYKKHKETSIYPKMEGYNQLKYQIIRKYGGWDNWNMIELEKCDLTIQTDEQAHKIEEKWRKELDAKLNMKKAFRSKEDLQEYQKDYTAEWRRDNKEYKKEQDKQYREENAEAIKAQKNQKFTCECGGKYTNSHKQEHLKTKKHKDWELTQECKNLS